jgi:multiple sugar transport system permease protein
MTARRGIFLTGIFVLCAWTLVPLYFIALGAVGGREAVNSWPKAFWPTSVSFTTLREFLNIAGVWTSTLYSVEAAVLCMFFPSCSVCLRAMRWRASPSAAPRHTG